MRRIRCGLMGLHEGIQVSRILGIFVPVSEHECQVGEEGHLAWVFFGSHLNCGPRCCDSVVEVGEIATGSASIAQGYSKAVQHHRVCWVFGSGFSDLASGG